MRRRISRRLERITGVIHISDIDTGSALAAHVPGDAA